MTEPIDYSTAPLYGDPDDKWAKAAVGEYDERYAAMLEKLRADNEGKPPIPPPLDLRDAYARIRYEELTAPIEEES